jgi:predicted kinase
MDLTHRRRSDLAWRFVNAYLEHTGDYAAVRLLRYYLVYRALVRAKVAAIRAAQPDMERTQRQALQAKCHTHLALAKDLVEQALPALIIHHGLSGSGKTTASQAILEATSAIRIRSDIERKRLYGLDAQARSGSAVAAGIYGSEATSAAYHHLALLAEQAVAGGFPVLVDATFLKRTQRESFRELARRLGVAFAIADFPAAEATLRERIVRRVQAGTDASEADIAVLEHQLATQEPLSGQEQGLTTRFDTERMDTHEIRAEARRMLVRLSA